MVLEAIYAVIFTLIAASSWHFIYKWFVHEGATVYESLMLTSVFQSMICTACFLVELKDNGMAIEVKDNVPMEEFYMISAAGFFFHDTPHWQARHTLTSYTLLLHHIVAFIFLLATIFFGKGGSIAIQVSFYMEVTTPLLAVRHYLKKLKINSCSIDVLFAVLFVGLRFWLGADIMLFILQKEDVPLPFKVGIVIIYFMSCGLLPGVVRMILSSNPRPDKKRSQKQSRVVRHQFVTTLSRPTNARPSSSTPRETDSLFENRI